MTKEVLVTGSHMVDDRVCAHINERGFEVRRVLRDDLGPDDLHAALAGVSGYLIGGYEVVLDEHFGAHPQLEAVGWIGSDYRSTVPGWRRGHELGIAFITSPGTNTTAVAEFTILLCMIMARPSIIGLIGGPGSEPPQIGPGWEHQARRMGILGLGRIGTRVAEIARRGLRMEVAYYSRCRRPHVEDAIGITYLSRSELLSSSDVLCLHRTGPEPGELPELRERDFATMRRGSLLINTVHPGLVDAHALLKAVREQGLRAAFDGVGAGEPWPELMALGADRFLATPSIAFDTLEANRRGAMVAADAVCDVLSGATSSFVDNLDFRSVRSTRRGS